MKIKAVIILTLLKINLSAQEPCYLPCYLSNLKPKDVSIIVNSNSKEVPQPDGNILKTSVVEEADEVFFVDKQGFPDTKEALYIYIVEGLESNGLRNGLFIFAAINTDKIKWTLIKEMTYKNDTLNGPYVYYYADSSTAKKGEYLLGRQDGDTYIYYPDGKIYSRYSFSNGKIHGVMTDYYSNGNTKMIMQVKDGNPHGKYRKFYSDNKLQEEWNYLDGQADGKYQYYHSNGQLWVEKEFKDNLLFNVVANYDSGGHLKDKGTLKNGNGTVKYYDDKGNLYLVEYYKAGEKIREESF